MLNVIRNCEFVLFCHNSGSESFRNLELLKLNLLKLNFAIRLVSGRLVYNIFRDLGVFKVELGSFFAVYPLSSDVKLTFELLAFLRGLSFGNFKVLFLYWNCCFLNYEQVKTLVSLKRLDFIMFLFSFLFLFRILSCINFRRLLILIKFKEIGDGDFKSSIIKRKKEEITS
jgi:hypothetical protein